MQSLANTTWRRHALSAAILVVVIQFLAYGGLIAAELVPDTWIANRLVEALHSGDLTQNEYSKSPSGQQIDHYTECIVLTEGLGDPVDSSPFETAATSPDLGRCEAAVPHILEYEQTGGIKSGGLYFRYWHGYAVVTRPLLAWLGVAGTRWVCALALIASIGWCMFEVKRSFGPWIACALTVPALITTDVLETANTVPHAIAWTCAFACGALATRCFTRRRQGLGYRTALLFGVACGSLVAYFDLMIAMPANLCIVGCIAALAYRRDDPGHSPVRSLVMALVVGAGWGVGIVTTWLSKWLAAASFLGSQTVLDNVRHQIGFRLNGAAPDANGGFTAASRDNLNQWLSRPLTWPFIIVAVALCAGVVAVKWRRGRAELGWLAVFAVLACAVPAWFELLSSHSQVHYWLTYRSLAISLSALLIGTIASCSTRDSDGEMSPT